jgi:hypothetical protein
MQAEEPERTKGLNDNELLEGAGNDEGPPTPHDQGGVVPDTVEGHQDTAEGD